jgi:hypothetical protein
VGWAENGALVSASADYGFNATTNRLLIANFTPAVIPQMGIGLVTNTVVVSWPTNSIGFTLEQTAIFNPTNWFAVTNFVSVVGTNNEVIISPPTGYRFFRLAHP